jgi:hypothetical protein
MGKTEEQLQEGLSIEDVFPFFEKFRLPLRVFDKFYKLIFKYDPPTRNHHYKAMYCMMADRHIYTLDFNVKELQQKQTDECYKVFASPTYLTPDEPRKSQAKMINNIDDILGIMRNTTYTKDDKQYIKLIHREDDLVELLHQFINAGYSPGISFESGRITGLKIVLKNVLFSIETQQLIKSAIDGVIVIDNEQTYNNMSNAMSTIHSKIFLKTHKSYFTEDDLLILNEYRTKPIVGNIGSNQDNMIEIDISRAYTSQFSQITKIPIFNEFDNFKPYNNEAIQPYNLYVVTNYNHPLVAQSHILLYGQFIKPGMYITYVKQPSFIKHVNYKALVDELYSTRISEDDRQDAYIKKLIANVNIGLLEKSINRKSKGFLFEHLDECQFYQSQYGGVIHRLDKIEQINNIDDWGLDDGIDTKSTQSIKFQSTGKPFYVLVIKDECQMQDGFRCIKELIMQMHNQKMMDAYDTLQNTNIQIHSVKTDCFTIKADDLDKTKSSLDFDNGFGSWRLSKTEDIIYPYEKIMIKQCQSFSPIVPTKNDITITNEWDTNEICEQFEKHKRVMVRAEYAGCGKSYACKSMEKRNHKVLFVCPTNKLVQNNRENGITLNMFFGVGMSEDKNQRISKFDDKSYDVIVFDEIYFASIRMLAKIRKYVKDNQDKIIIATGDTNQLECIDLISDQIEYDQYMDHCINSIFPNSIYLTKNKRLKTDADKIILNRFKADIFNIKKDPIKTIKKYFKVTNEIETINNIAYKNSTCVSVSAKVREKLKMKEEYEVGEMIVCRKFLKVKKSTLHVNFEYEIDQINGDEITIFDGLETFVTLDRDLLKKYFVHAYCRTCHSFQGSSIDDKITIFDWRFKFVNRKWIYTAVTRATNLKHVYFYCGKLEQEIDDDEHKSLNKYLELKVANYIKQDLQHGREITSNYVTPDWLKKQFGKQCSECGDCLRYDYENNKVNSNVSADRIDCSECHHIYNIVPLCVTCNQKTSCWK